MRTRGIPGTATAALLACSGVFALAQDALRITTETRIVQVEIIVKDSTGRPVEDLTKENFTILDNGKPREFQTFNHERADAAAESAVVVSSGSKPANVFTNRILPAGTDHHVTVVLIDGTGGWETFNRNLPSLKGVLNAVKPGEPIAIYSAVPRLHVIQEFTTDRGLIIRTISKTVAPKAITKVSVPADVAKDAPAVMKTTPRESALWAGGNEYEMQAAMRQLAAHLSSLPGRKSLIWLTTTRGLGYMNEWRAAWDGIVDSYNAANIEINPIDNQGVWGLQTENKFGVLSSFAKRTGGHLYYKGNDISGAIAQAMTERHSTYTLAFYLADNERDNRLHALSVKVNRPGIELQYRQGYMPNIDRRMDDINDATSRTADILKNPLDAAELPFSVTVDPPVNGKQAFHISIEPQAVRLVAHDPGWTAKIDQQYFQMDEEGGVYGKISNTKTVEVDPRTRNLYDRQGPNWIEEMPMTEKATLLRVILRDPETKRIGSLTIPLK